MIIAPKFVFVHCQKTGGTFVNEVLRNLYCPKPKYQIVYKLRKKYGIRFPGFRYRYQELKEQHAWCSDIPDHARDKPIFSVVRNPYSFYRSVYTFEWWKRDLKGQLKDKRRIFFDDKERLFQAYPDILEADFPRFLSAAWRFSRWTRMTVEQFPQAENLGMCTLRYVYFYCADPGYAFAVANDRRQFLARVRESHFDVHFLHQEALNNELYDFLVSVGHRAAEVQPVLSKEPVNVSNRGSRWMDDYSIQARNEVLARDWLLFELFPEYAT